MTRVPFECRGGDLERLFATVAVALIAQAATGQMPAQWVRGERYCAALAPPGYRFIAENPAGTAFGADLVRGDGAVVASYLIVGVDGSMRTSQWYSRYYGTPHQAVMTMLSQMGKVPIQCGAPSSVDQNLQLMQCKTPQYVGHAIYQVFPAQNNGYVVVIRTASAVPAIWAQESQVASAIARSIRCNVPLKPTSVDWTSRGSSAGKGRRRGEADSGYSRWLGMEHYHDARTGQNYWVSPSRDWRDNGPQGPGYYAQLGNESRRLEPGRSD